ncbi:GNAT family N-acetyltransferase [Gryllotalpicola reticulitermitis]|uniref:GNAT family N-acetyltransferase n=1 Tax=Gryllotalpicola reticulitermitis TaxID=1184153 RepID=A0ABV8Q9L2_9MICO
MPEFLVRPLRAEEWERAKDFRLEALRDEIAPVAFITTFDEAVTWADEVWQKRAWASSESADPSARQRALVAVDDGKWLGTLTVLVTAAGQKDYAGRVLPARTADVVGVYVTPAARGNGVVQALLEAAADWAAAQGISHLQLFVHEHNPRAQRAYEKSGFLLTDEAHDFGNGSDLRMVRVLSTAK